MGGSEVFGAAPTPRLIQQPFDKSNSKSGPMAKPPLGPGAHKKHLISLLRDNARRYRLFQVFQDFAELAALAISNAVDKSQYARREARYMEIVRKYEREEVFRFGEMLAALVEWLECGHADCMGELFMALELGDAAHGQFFTPYSVASLMAKVTLVDARSVWERQGFISISEPAAGAGAMLIACAEEIANSGLNASAVMHATAVDVDATAVHMSYVQLSLLGIPGIVIHGNSLSLEEWSHWVTPAHVFGGWDYRLRKRALRNSEEQVQSQDAPRAERGRELVESVVAQTGADARSKPTATDRMAAAREEILASRLEQMSLFG
jgi:hypothetical protein